MADLNFTLAEILTCACSILDTGSCKGTLSKCKCPCRAFVTVGPPVWDLISCCDGQLAVWSEEIFPFTRFPSRGGDVTICTPSLAATVKVQLLRCWSANIKEDGSAPSAAQIQVASDDIYRDQELLTNGLVCCLKAMGRNRLSLLNGSRIIGPQGGCVGVEISLTVQISQ